MIGIAKLFTSIQGEGRHTGERMSFVRTAGCSIGCPQCDTDYKKTKSMSVDQIVDWVVDSGTGKLWLTGGEPTDHKEYETIRERCQLLDIWCGIATSGVRDISHSWDYVYLSPHSVEGTKLLRCHDLNIVLGLNDLTQEAASRLIASITHDVCYLTPLYGSDYWANECYALSQRLGCRLGVQYHKILGVE